MRVAVRAAELGRPAGQRMLGDPLPAAQRRQGRRPELLGVVASPPGRAGTPDRDRCRRAAGPARPACPGASSTTPERTASSSRTSSNSWVPAVSSSTAARSSAACGPSSVRSTSTSTASADRALRIRLRCSNWREQHRPQPVQAAAAAQLGGQLARGPHDPGADQLDRQPDAEQPEPVQQVLPLQLGQRDRRRSVDEAVDGEQQLVGRLARRPGQRGQQGVLRLPQRRCRVGQQPVDREHDRAEPAHPRVGLVALGDPVGHLHGVQPAGPDLVGPAEHADRVHRRPVGELVVVEGLQEPYVAGVGVPHQVEHRVGDRHPAVVRGQHPVGPGGDVGGDRGDARGVQDGQVAEPAGRPADLDPVHVGRGQLAEVDLERAALPGPRPGHRRCPRAGGPRPAGPGPRRTR